MNSGELGESLDFRHVPALPPDRLKQIQAALAADLKPVRPLAPAGVYAAAFLAIAAGICFFGWRYIIGQRGWNALSNLQRWSVFVPILAIAVLLVFSVVQQMAPASRYTRSSALTAGGISVLLAAVIFAIFQPAHETAFARNGLVCFRFGLLFAIPAALLFGFLLLRGAGLSPLLTGAAAGGLAGLVGLTVLEIHCPNLNVYHIAAWHLSVFLTCIAAGLIFSRVTFSRGRSK